MLIREEVAEGREAGSRCAWMSAGVWNSKQRTLYCFGSIWTWDSICSKAC